jgi:hypothetical protein
MKMRHNVKLALSARECAQYTNGSKWLVTVRINRLTNMIRCLLNVQGDVHVYSSSATMQLMMNLAYENWLGYFAEHCHIPESLWGTEGLIMARPRCGKSVPYLKGVLHGYYVPPYSEWAHLC